MKVQLTLALMIFYFNPIHVFSQNKAGKNKLEDSIEKVIYLSLSPETKANKRIALEWTSNHKAKQNFFTIERSFNGKEYEVIGVIKARPGQTSFEFTDESPSSLKNFYRISETLEEGKIIFSNVLMGGVAGDIFCKFYPNPVERFLILRSENSIELKITDPLSRIRINKVLEPGLQLIDVSSLEKGIYIISLTQKESNKIMTDKLIKN